jgi:hypothetical protein
MGFCLDCHRSPENHLRPLEEVFNLDYDAEKYLTENEILDASGNRISTQKDLGKFLKAHWNIQAKDSCSTCHR